MELSVAEEFKALMKRADDDPAQLVLKADQNRSLLNECLNPALSSLWDIAWSQMNCNPSMVVAQQYKQSYIPLKSQKSMPSFLLYSGIIFYYQWKKEGNIKLLAKAASEPYFSIHAMRDHATIILRELQNANDQFLAEKLVDKLLSYGQSAATHHLSPGYLLCTFIYIELAVFFYKCDPVRSLAFYKTSYLNLEIAQKLLLFSQAETHNAFFGRADNNHLLNTFSQSIPEKVKIPAYKKKALEIAGNIIDQQECPELSGDTIMFKF